MIIDNRALLAFLSLARTLSFTKTAIELGLTQPRLSYIVRKFESELGFDLFVRTTRRVELTAAGEQFRVAALDVEASLGQANDLISQLRGDNRVRLRVGAPSYTTRVAARLQILNEYAAKHPRVSIEVTYGRTPDKLDELRAGDVDVVFATDPESLVGLESVVIARSMTCVLLPAEHKLASMQVVPVSALRGETVVCTPRATMPSGYFDRWYAAAVAAGAILLEAPETDNFAMMHFASARNALLLSYKWQNGFDRVVGTMVTRPLVGASEGCELHVVRRNSLHSLPLEWFWDVAQRHQAPPVEKVAVLPSRNAKTAAA